MVNTTTIKDNEDKVREWLELLGCEDVSVSELHDPNILSGFFYLLRSGGNITLNSAKTPLSEASHEIKDVLDKYEEEHERDYDKFNNGMKLGMRFSEFRTFCDHDAVKLYGLNLQNTPSKNRHRYFRIHKKIKYGSKYLQEEYCDEILDMSDIITRLYEDKIGVMEDLLLNGDYENALHTWDYLYMILNYYEKHENIIKLELKARQGKQDALFSYDVEHKNSSDMSTLDIGYVSAKIEELRKLRLDINKRKINPVYSLEKRMEIAVAREAYEVAAELRDEIAELL